ncbi:unnamed protein product [Schistosoma margrebowiei]|uniref:Uncharacterized protein n=1 Tax=Schistosoma margrebowiei TaxID=48269 RepID=A0A183LP70_9TREM|nr:unnamed protein product [Schistosoma margrebowiei]
MTLASNRLQLLFEQQLEFLVKLRTQLPNHSCFGDATEVDGLVSQLHTELENDCSLHESSTNLISNDTAVTQDPPSGPVLSISETCPVIDSNFIIPETACADSDLSSSQTDALLNDHRIVAVTAHETENKSSSTLNAAAPNGSQKSATEVPDESYYSKYKITGNARDSQDVDLIRQLNVTHIINVTDSLPMPFRKLNRIQYLHIPASDTTKQNLLPSFDRAVQFIVHCDPYHFSSLSLFGLGSNPPSLTFISHVSTCGQITFFINVSH